MSHTFRSLRIRNYRLWAAGALVSNVGTWMQRTAQDWLVLTHLTKHNATAVGIVMALQFGPQLVLLPFTGLAADRLNRRRLLMATQAAMGLLALGLGLLTMSGMAQLWHVHVFALLLGCVAAFDAPARQTFVAELVSETELSNAVALNATSFHAARMVGPAVAGLVIAATGPGEAFLLNALSFMAVLASLACLRQGELFARQGAAGGNQGSLMEGLRYVWRRPDLRMHAIGFTEVLRVDHEAGIARVRYTARPEFAHTQGTVVQGGLITAWLDSAMAFAVIARDPEVQAEGGDQEQHGQQGKARVLRWGRSVVFLEADLFSEGGDLLVRASSTGKLLRPARP